MTHKRAALGTILHDDSERVLSLPPFPMNAHLSSSESDFDRLLDDIDKQLKIVIAKKVRRQSAQRKALKKEEILFII